MAGYNNYFPQTYSNMPYSYGVGANVGQNQLGAINWVQGEYENKRSYSADIK